MMKKVENMNYYELLNIEPTAHGEEIQRAYQLAYQTYQPDSLALYSVLSEEERAQMLERIEKAYRTLIDKRERERYDRQIGISSDWKEEEKKEDKEGPKNACTTALSSRFDQPEYHESSQDEEEPMPEISDPRYLKKIRERKKISLREISEVTRISFSTLTALENGEYEKFPSRVYIVGFLRSYAEFIGIDVQQAKAHFEILYGQYNKSKKN